MEDASRRSVVVTFVERVSIRRCQKSHPVDTGKEISIQITSVALRSAKITISTVVVVQNLQSPISAYILSLRIVEIVITESYLLLMLDLPKNVFLY